MRVLWIGHNLAYPPVRGVLQRNYNLLREAAKGAEVHVLAFDQPRSRPPGVSPEDCVAALRSFCAYVECVPLQAGVTRSRYFLGLRGLLSRNAFDFNWLASGLMTVRLRHLVDRTKFDVIHFDTLGLAQYRPLVRGPGTVLNHHNIESSMMNQRVTTESRRANRQYWRWEAQKLRGAEQRYCPQFAVNLVVSPEDGELLAGIAPGVRTRVVANGVDTEFFTPRPDPGGSTLLFCGGLDWYPNSDAMAFFFHQIWPLLKRRFPEVRVIVVGRNPPNWLVRLGAADSRVEVTGFVDDVRTHFARATAYFCPIRLGGGTRLKILDALAMGVPIVGTAFACSGISVQHEKHVLIADTPEAFVTSILRAFSEPTLRANLAAQGRKLVSDAYSWSVVGKDLLLAYRKASAVIAQRSGIRNGDIDRPR